MSILYPVEGNWVYVTLNNGEKFPAIWIAETPSAIKVHTRVLKLIPWSNIKEIMVNDHVAEGDPVLLEMKQKVWDLEVKIEAAAKKEKKEA